MDTAEWYRAFAEFEAAGTSPTYEHLCRAIADDDQLLGRIGALPAPKQQPNLLLAACRFLGAPMGDSAATIEYTYSNWGAVEDVVMSRWTQTNEAARTAAFLPLLAQMDGPLALIEVGASAGLCLYPDRYRIVYDGVAVGPAASPVQIDVATAGPVPVPTAMPEIRSRTGIDRNPLDVTDLDDLRWLEACIWPEHTERMQRLRAAAEVVAADPPDMVRGDLLDEIDGVLAGVPDDITPVVFHSAVLNYLAADQRDAFAARMAAHPRATWLSNEGRSVFPALRTDLTPPAVARSKAMFVLGVDGRRVAAISDPHGSWLRWAP